MTDTKREIFFLVGNTRNRVIHEHKKVHCKCLNCGSDRTAQTLKKLALGLNNSEDYVDRNQAICSDCGWKGIVHELTK